MPLAHKHLDYGVVLVASDIMTFIVHQVGFHMHVDAAAAGAGQVVLWTSSETHVEDRLIFGIWHLSVQARIA
jgi:hypothetical protein